MEIDTITLQTAQRKFESRYHSNFNDLGLSKSAKRKLQRYGMIPGKIHDHNEVQELLHITSEYKKILNSVMKPNSSKSYH